MTDLRSLNKDRFKQAKRLWTASIALKVFIFSVGAISVWMEKPSHYIPQLLLVVAVVSELVQWRADVIKSRSESLLRHLDLCRSFPREMSEADKRDILSYIPRKIRAKFDATTIPDTYFVSSNPPGTRRAVENLVESAWYTRRQSESMVLIYIALIAAVMVISIGALMVASQELGSTSAREGVSKVVTSWLLLIFSLGLVKNAWSYYKMIQRCHRAEASGEYLLKGEIAEPDALKQWYEYQIARASAPLLPEWLWKVMQPSLDDAWRRGRQD